MKRLNGILFLLFFSLATASFLSFMLTYIEIGSLCANFKDMFLRGFAICYIAFSGFFTVAAVLVLLTNMDTSTAICYGAGFYYGTAVCYVIINNYTDPVTAIILSAVIAGLICYIFWLKRKSIK